MGELGLTFLGEGRALATSEVEGVSKSRREIFWANRHFSWSSNLFDIRENWRRGEMTGRGWYGVGRTRRPLARVRS